MSGDVIYNTFDAFMEASIDARDLIDAVRDWHACDGCAENLETVLMLAFYAGRDAGIRMADAPYVPH